MADDVKQKIDQKFKVIEENPDLKKIQKKILEREQLLFERKYYENMQKEIIEVFGARPFRIEVPSAEEQAAMQRIFASLQRTIIDNNRKASQAELEKLFPELRHVHEAENRAEEEKAKAEEELQKKRLEQEKLFREMENKYRAILENIDAEIQGAADAVQQAARSQKEAEKQRLLMQKAEEEALLKREKEAAERAAQEAAERRARIAAEERAKAEARARAEAEQRARQQAERERKTCRRRSCPCRCRKTEANGTSKARSTKTGRGT